MPKFLKTLKQRDLLFFLLLTILIFLIYMPWIGNDLVSDDLGIRKDTYFITDFGNLFTKLHSFFRLLLYYLTNQFCGLESYCLRFPNLLFHIGNSIAVFLLVRRLVTAKVAVFASLLFATHPLVSEPIYWISAGNYPQYTFFFLLSFFFYIRNSKRSDYYLSLILFTIGTLTTNRLFGLPIFFIYEFTFGNLRLNYRKLIPYVTIFAAVFVYYLKTIGLDPQEASAPGQQLTTNFYEPWIQIPFALFTYLKLFIWPEDLTFSHSLIDVSLPQTILRSLIAILLVGFWLACYKLNKQLFFWLGFFLGGLLLYLTPYKLAWMAAERYAYLASIGLCAITALVIGFLEKKLLSKKTAIALFAVIIAVLSFRTYTRGGDWKNQVSFYESIIATNPQEIYALNALASYYAENKEFPKALNYFHKAFDYDPNNYLISYNLGYIYSELNQTMEALFFFNRAARLSPNPTVALEKMLQLYQKIDDKDMAKATAQKILTINPQNQPAQLFLNSTK